MKREFDGKIRKVGNSFVVTIPINTVERYNLKENKFVTVLITDDEPIRKKRGKKMKFKEEKFKKLKELQEQELSCLLYGVLDLEKKGTVTFFPWKLHSSGC